MTRRAGRDIRIRFGLAVKKRRTELGISQEKLAERADLHRTYVADVERGSRNPSLRAIEKLAAGLGLDLADLFGRLSD
jgi:transcriptional regulator with XRE-family HTH domain